MFLLSVRPCWCWYIQKYTTGVYNKHIAPFKILSIFPFGAPVACAYIFSVVIFIYLSRVYIFSTNQQKKVSAICSAVFQYVFYIQNSHDMYTSICNVSSSSNEFIRCRMVLSVLVLHLAGSEGELWTVLSLKIKIKKQKPG